jgi:hypothetical protein
MLAAFIAGFEEAGNRAPGRSPAAGGIAHKL